MLTSEAELAADTKIDKDGRGVRSSNRDSTEKSIKRASGVFADLRLFQNDQNQNFKTCFV